MLGLLYNGFTAILKEKPRVMMWHGAFIAGKGKWQLRETIK